MTDPLPIVLLHSARTSTWAFRRSIPLLEPWPCLALDLPGHGRHADLPWEGFEAAAHRVLGWIRGSVPKGRVHLVGHSAGAATGLYLLAMAPELVERAVLSGLSLHAHPLRSLLGPVQAALMPLLSSGLLTRATARALGAEVEEVREVTSRVRPETVGSMGREMLAGVRPEGLDQVRAQVLVLAGEKESGLARRTASDLPGLLPHATGALVERQDHPWCTREHELLARVVRAWVGEGELAEGLRPVPTPPRRG